MANELEIAALRNEYSLQSLSENDIDPNPIKQFEKWLDEALKSNLPEPNAMTLATCNKEGFPSARIVLLKGVDKNGFIFYSNYESRKARELNENPKASLVFLWKELERQVRIEGKVKKLDKDKSDQYFSTRPIKSQLGAWSSPQSSVIKDRSILEKNMEYYQQLFDGENIKRPPNWGGYLVDPVNIEFWQGRRSRLHDRLQYTFTEKGWQVNRLAP